LTIQKVTVFGGSDPEPGQPAYSEALRLGELLALAGYTVITGGYMGTMEAVSRGAAEAGGHVIGITCEEIEAWRPVPHNEWVLEEMRTANILDRMLALIEEGQAALALPGGQGTLAEIAVMWTQLAIGAIAPRPLVLIGSGWEHIFQSFYHELGGYVNQARRRWLQFAPDVDSAVYMLKKSS
jgi:uncharacterized protein (TIGR00730 family)